MSRTLLSGGLIAGALAGFVVALLQLWLIQPLIVEAERYETGELVLSLAQSEDPPATQASTHPGEVETHEPKPLRAGLTVLFLTLTWCGFGLLASAAMTASQRSEKARPLSALEIALSGFAVASVAPALGLPPELPGMPAADLGSRQMWWIMTLIATTAGLALAIRFKNGAAGAVALAAIALPHVVGAPAPPVAAPVVPPDLAALYVARVLGVSFVGWLILGALLERLLPEQPEKSLRADREVLD